MSQTTPSRPKRQRRVCPLRPGEIRWFHRSATSEEKWHPLIGADSLALEVQWRKQKNVEVDADNLAHFPFSDTVVVLDGLYKLSPCCTRLTPVYWKGEEIQLRRGTWFYADGYQPLAADLADEIEAHHLQHFGKQVIPDTPVFFERETRETKKPVLTDLKLEQCEVRWNSVIDVIMHDQSTRSRLLRAIAMGKGIPLTRGYRLEATWDDAVKPVGHLVLVVHGIGQKGYESLIAKNTDTMRDAMQTMIERFYRDEPWRPMILPIEWRSGLVLDGDLTELITLPRMSSVRNTLNSTVMDIIYYQSPLYRTEILSGLVTRLNSVHSLFMQLNPSFDGPISLFAHSLGSVMCYDVITDWSPLLLYDQYVTAAIDERLEKKEKGEDGESELPAEVLREFQDARQNLRRIEGGIRSLLSSPNQRLHFKVCNLFCVGSPLAVFLVMRGQEPPTIVPDETRLKRIFNIFHPYDPVAYRLEPLFHKNYRPIRPVKVHAANSARDQVAYALLPPEIHKRLIKAFKAEKPEKVEKQEEQQEEEGEVQQAGEDDLDEEDCESDDSSGGQRPQSPASSSRQSGSPVPSEEVAPTRRWWQFGSGRKEAVEIGKEITNNDEPRIDDKKMKKLAPALTLLEAIPQNSQLQRRLDFFLRPALTDKSYWSVLKAHFSYWTNADLTMFLLSQIYDQQP